MGDVTFADGLKTAWVAETLSSTLYHRQQLELWGRPDFCRFELLEGRQEVVPYLDWDSHLPSPPDALEVDLYEQTCRKKVQQLLEALDVEDTQVLLAQRHGVVPKTGKWKASVRAYVPGLKVVMADMRDIIVQQDQGDFWDLSVYSTKQKLGIVGSCKGADADYRVLTPIGDWDPALATVQMLRGDEFLIKSDPENVELQPLPKKRRLHERDLRKAPVIYGTNVDALFQASKDNLERMFGLVKQYYPKTYGFDFHLMDTSKACFCTHVHESNAYRCYEVFGSCVRVVNYSDKCHPCLLGWREHPLIQQLISLPTSDQGYVDIFRAAQQLKGFTWKWDDDRKTFYKFDGTIWRKAADMEVNQETQEVCSQLLKALLINMRYNREVASADDTAVHKAFIQASKHVAKSSSAKSATEMAKVMLYEIGFKDKLDADTDLLGCHSGIIHLPTGRLITKNPDVFVSHQAEAKYLGIDAPTPLIDAFFCSIFNGDAEVIDYMQRLLGYGLNGTQKEQVWAVCLGTGSNGKSLLNRMLTTVMGSDYYLSMERDVIFQNDKKASTGQASAHLAKLEGRRIAVLDDADEGGVLNDGVIKQMTGGALMTCRMLYSNPISFQPTHLPILLTNHRPRMNVDDEAMKRRLIMVPFLNVYKPAHELDTGNPRHRMRDDDLETTLLGEEGMQQFLSWLVKGSVGWSKKGLGQRPRLLADAQEEMYMENDALGSFIKEHCKIDDGDCVGTDELRSAFQRVSETCISQGVLKDKMAKRGFAYFIKKRGGQRTRSFKGLSLL